MLHLVKDSEPMAPEQHAAPVPQMREQIKVLQRDVEMLTRRLDSLEDKQDKRHEDNTKILQGIALQIQGFDTTLKIGRWVMHALWAIAGTAIGGLLVKWLSKA